MIDLLVQVIGALVAFLTGWATSVKAMETLGRYAQRRRHRAEWNRWLRRYGRVVFN